MKDERPSSEIIKDMGGPFPPRPDPATCSHKFVDSLSCLKCGWSPPRPNPGEIWMHHAHGLVRIVRPWSNKESVCEAMDGGRFVLMNDLMRNTQGTIMELEIPERWKTSTPKTPPPKST